MSENLPSIDDFTEDNSKLPSIDDIIKEPVGGAHRDKELILKNVRNSLINNLAFFENMEGEEIFNQRKNRFLSIGRNKGFVSQTQINQNLSMQITTIQKLKNLISKMLMSFQMKLR